MNTPYRDMQSAAASNQANDIREASPTDKGREALDYLRQLESLHREIRAKLFGPTPYPPDETAKSTSEPCLDEILRHISQRSAMAVGDMQNLLSRI